MNLAPEERSAQSLAHEGRRRAEDALGSSRETVAGLLAACFVVCFGLWLVNLEGGDVLAIESEAAASPADAAANRLPTVSLTAYGSGFQPAGLSAAEVKQLQAGLRSKGFEPGPIDGIPGRRTLAALNAYRGSIDLPEVDSIDADTAADLLTRPQ